MTDLTTEDTVYVIYIATTPEKVWVALTSSAFTTKYFFGRTVESDWKKGSKWLLRMPDGRVEVVGVVRESDVENSKIIVAVAEGWPAVLASLKSFLETGIPLSETTKWPKDL